MSFKIAIFCSLLISSAYGFNLFHIFDDPAEIAPHVDCTGLADGSKLHDPTDCGYFYLCDGGASLRLKCRSTVPYFDRCTGNCAESLDVCNVAECPGSTQAPTQAPTDGPTQAPTNAPTDAPTQAPTDAPTNAPTDAPTESTTKFVPPTVPTTCDPECLPTDEEYNCKCEKQWTCMNKKCACDKNIECPMIKADCIKPEPDGCGCEERCDCTDDNNCFCKTESIQCPFEDKAGECVKKCGCQNNCECTTAATDTTPASGCTCKATCACIEPPKVCPFKPADCIVNCSCKERCLCNGDFCTCDGDNACPASFWKRH